MTSRDAAVLIADLRDASRAADKLCAHLEDLHAQAYERHVGDHERTSGAAWPPPGVESIGDPRAKALWRRAVALSRHLRALAVLEREVLNLFSAGPGPEETRGSLISSGDFARALKAQRRRDDTPERLHPQPDYPGGGKKR